MLELLGQCARVEIPEMSEQAVSFYRSGVVLWSAEQIWALLLPCLFLVTGFSGRLASFAEKRCKIRYFSIALYLVLFFLSSWLLSLPLDLYASYFRPHSYGLSTQSLALWFDHYGKQCLITLGFSLATVWIFYWLLAKSPKRWWLYSSFVGIALSFFTVALQPIWIDPLFNDFGPMKNKELEQQILDLAAGAGIEKGRIYEVNKSQETKMLNAYVIGFGETKRIVFWDTLLQQMSPAQVLFVVGHEMGHYVLGHMWWSFLYYSALLLAMFYLASKWALSLLARFHKLFRFNKLSSIASLPLFFFVFTALSLLSDPLSCFIQRIEERQADRFGLELTKNNQAAGEAFVILQKSNLANPRPDPFSYFWRCSHPSLEERIKFANSYCPWEGS
ncbi:MAG: M48 family metallopeptidase [Chlamydiales bacterium]|nr:M48 family metallopeptidase [Chlamydiales bacterium]